MGIALNLVVGQSIVYASNPKPAKRTATTPPPISRDEPAFACVVAAALEADAVEEPVWDVPVAVPALADVACAELVRGLKAVVKAVDEALELVLG